MNHLFLVIIFIAGLMIKAGEVAGADAEFVVDAKTSEVTTESTATKPLVASVTSDPLEPIDTTGQVQPQLETAVVTTAEGAQASGGAGGALLTTEPVAEAPTKRKVYLTPLIGGSVYTGGYGNNLWKDHIYDGKTFGIAIDVPLSNHVNFEVEGARGDYDISYGSYGPMGNYVAAHGFHVYSLGGNLKLYPLSHSVLQPYAGAGLMGLWYKDISSVEMRDPFIGAGQLMLGTDFFLSERFALGVRGAWVQPLFNRPNTYPAFYGPTTLQGYEEASAVNQGFVRIMGTVKMGL